MAPPMLLAVILHEISHGLAAGWLGDPTARKAGRISLNPLRHIDPMMTIILPGILIMSGSPFIFGGAKPVPVNAAYFDNPRRGMCWVALAGPVCNFLLAFLSYGLLQLLVLSPLTGLPMMLIGQILAYSLLINVVLGTFNLIPIPPLDGGRIAVGLLPISLARPLAQLERYGIMLVMLLLFSGWLEPLLAPFTKLALDALP
jgi:Zn-dependent protease